MEGGREGGKDLFTHPLLLRIDTAIEQLLQKRQSKPKREKGIAGGREGGREGGKDRFTHPLLLRIGRAVVLLRQKRQTRPRRRRGCLGGCIA